MFLTRLVCSETWKVTEDNCFLLSNICPRPVWISLQCRLSAVLVTKSHRRHIMGLQQPIVQRRWREKFMTQQMGKASQMPALYCRTKRGTQALDGHPLPSGRASPLCQNRKIHLSLLAWYNAEIGHRNYGELDICNSGQ